MVGYKQVIKNYGSRHTCEISEARNAVFLLTELRHSEILKKIVETHVLCTNKTYKIKAKFCKGSNESHNIMSLLRHWYYVISGETPFIRYI